MAQPKAKAALCDVPGCGRPADKCSDGTEKESNVEPGTDPPRERIKEPRPALPNLNVCNRHGNWPHSPDAKAWVANNQAEYAARGGK